MNKTAKIFWKAGKPRDEREKKLIIIKYGKKSYYGYVFVAGKKAKKLYQAVTKDKLSDKVEDAIAEGKERNYQDTKIYNIADFGLKKCKMKEDRDVCAVHTASRFSEELKKFCATPERCRMALHMLSGLIVQRYTDFIGQAPENVNILQIERSKNRNVITFLRAVADSFVRNRSGHNKHLRLVQAPYLPADFRNPTVEDSAYITDTSRETLRMPPVYENTAVVVNGYALKGGVEKLIKGNWYCQTVLYGNVPKSLEAWVADRVSAEQLGSLTVDWDVDCLKQMTYELDAWITDEKAQEAFVLSRKVVDKNVQPKVNPYKFNWKRMELYMATAILLASFLCHKDNLDTTSKTELCNLLYNAVLPGCYTPPTESGVPLETIPLSEENFEEAVRQTISLMLEDLSRYRFIQPGESCLTEEELEQKGIDGFLRLFETDKTCKTQVRSVLFYKQTFFRRFKELCPYRCEDEKLLDKLLSAFAVGKLAGYCPVRSVSKDRFNEKALASVRLLVDKLDFLSDEKKEELEQAFKTED